MTHFDFNIQAFWGLNLVGALFSVCNSTSLLRDNEPGESSTPPPLFFCPLARNTEKHHQCNHVANCGSQNPKIKQGRHALPLGDDGGLVWRRDQPPPYYALRGAAEHPSPSAPARLRCHSRRVVIVLHPAVALLGERLHLVPEVLHAHVELLQLLDGPETQTHSKCARGAEQAVWGSGSGVKKILRKLQQIRTADSLGKFHKIQLLMSATEME